MGVLRDFFVYYLARIPYRAFCDTRSFFEWGRKTLVSAVMYILGLYSYYKIFGVGPVAEKIIDPFLLVILPAFAVFVLLFSWNLILAPVRLMQEEEEKSRGLQTQVETLTDRLRSKFGILFVPGVPPFEQSDSLENGTVVRRLFRVGVKNIGAIAIRDARVKLERLVALDQTPPGVGAFHDVELHQMYDIPPADQLYQRQFTLPSEETQYIDVVMKDEDVLNHDSRIILYYAVKSLPKTISCGRYELVIRATGIDTTAKRGTFFVDVDAEGRLMFWPKEATPS